MSTTGSRVVAPGTTVEKLAGGFSAKGPTCKTLVVEQGSDGMTLDAEGHLYLTGDGVTVFDPSGRQIEHIRIPDEKWTANVAFGGKERQMLFITASTGLYGIRMRIRGANAAK
jgi:gluconolactonase